MVEVPIALPALGPAAQIWLVLGCLSGMVLLAVLALMLERCSSIRLRHFAEEAGGGLRRLYDQPLAFEAFRFLLSTLARLALACLVASITVLWISLDHGPAQAAGVAIGVVALAVLALELISRGLVRGNPEDWLRRLTPLYKGARLLLTPFILLLAPLMVGSAPEEDNGEDEDEASDQEIEAFIAIGEREGILEPDEVKMVRGVVDFGDTQVRSVMTPRTDIVGAPADTSLFDLATLFVQSNHSRLPLYAESLDRVVGILLMRDLLSGLQAPEPPPAAELAKPVHFVPGSKPVAELLREMQQSQQHVALVVDEHGGTAGLVTMEDLLEEIVGEIADEHDEVAQEVWQLEDGSWRVDGRIHLDELAELVGMQVDDVPYETVAGLVLSELGDVPQAGAVVIAYGFSMTVEEVADRRIASVRVAPLTPVAEEVESRD